MTFCLSFFFFFSCGWVCFLISAIFTIFILPLKHCCQHQWLSKAYTIPFFLRQCIFYLFFFTLFLPFKTQSFEFFLMFSSVSDIQVLSSCYGQILEIVSLVKKYVHICILLGLCIEILSFTCHWLWKGSCSCYVFFFFFLLQNLSQRCVLLPTLKKMVELEVY